MQTYSNNQFQATEVSILEAFGRSTELNWSQHFLLERYQFFIAISESTKMNPYTSSPVILSKKEKKALQNKKYRERLKLNSEKTEAARIKVHEQAGEKNNVC